MTNTQHMRKRLLERAGLPTYDGTYQEIRTRVNTTTSKFFTLMKNRLVFGHMRYGPLASPDKPRYDNMKTLRAKLDLYEQTGNDEILVDIANYALVEFVEGRHPKKHFSATDDTHHATVIP